METNFEVIKAEILNRAKAARACAEEYTRAYKSETLRELCNVIKNNFNWCFNHGVITSDLLMQYYEDFAQNDIFFNASDKFGFILCDNGIVRAWGNATVIAWGEAIVEAWDNATVESRDNTIVKAYGNATVRAYGNATVHAYNGARVLAIGNVTVRARDNATVEAYSGVTVRAWDNAYCTSYNLIECSLSDNAIYRVQSTNTVYYASNKIKFIKQ